MFLDQLVENCKTFANKFALEFDDGEQLTYAQLEQRVQQTMRWLLEQDVQKGDRIAFQLPKSFSFLYIHLAAMRLGAISMPLNPAYPPAELGYFLADAQVRLLIGDAGLAAAESELGQRVETLEKLVVIDDEQAFLDKIMGVANAIRLIKPPTDPDQTALMVYTSGTTGRPKGALITHGNFTASVNGLHEAWGWRSADRLLHVLPIFHLHGLGIALHGALNAGASTILMRKFDAEEALRLMVDRHCTIFMAVPTIHIRLLAVPDATGFDLSHMRLLTSGSDRLPDDVFLAFQETFGHTLLERYGMTETSINLSNPLHGERRVGSVGLPIPQVEVRIANRQTNEPLPDGQVGEVQIRGPHVCKGYWQKPTQTAAAFTPDGWLHSGDMGLREPDGYITLKGRSKDLIITGGYNVYPPEVELVLAEHPNVKASAVIGCPNPEWGETVTAVIVPNSDVTEEAIITFCRERMARYKAPRRVIFVEQFPSNALGKVQKAKLRDVFCS